MISGWALRPGEEPGKPKFPGVSGRHRGVVRILRGGPTTSEATREPVPEDLPMQRFRLYALAAATLLAFLGAPRHAWAQG